MTFGLTNAPSTFQSLMNKIFDKHLRQFLLVFFYDILVYSMLWQDQLFHLQTTFDILKMHSLFVRKNICSFGKTNITYLGHVISKGQVAMDRSKLEAVQNWPQPLTIKSLRGFLGLKGYYKKFIQNYGGIAAPLTTMLEKNLSIGRLRLWMHSIPWIKHWLQGQF